MRIRLIADEGMVYTNGEIFGSDITLAEGLTGEDFYQITRVEYLQKLNENMEENFQDDILD